MLFVSFDILSVVTDHHTFKVLASNFVGFTVRSLNILQHWHFLALIGILLFIILEKASAISHEKYAVIILFPLSYLISEILVNILETQLDLILCSNKAVFFIHLYNRFGFAVLEEDGVRKYEFAAFDEMNLFLRRQ